MRLTLLLFFFSAAWLSGAPEDLISISLEGTVIDRLPRAIDVIDANPSESAAALIQLGGQPNPGIPQSAFYREVFYIFQDAEKWTLQDGQQLSAGDIVYTFFVESQEEKEDFVRRYELELFGEMEDREGHAPTLYVASPRYYVLVMAPELHFTCSMHPKIVEASSGDCAICGMELVEAKGYR